MPGLNYATTTRLGRASYLRNMQNDPTGASARSLTDRGLGTKQKMERRVATYKDQIAEWLVAVCLQSLIGQAFGSTYLNMEVQSACLHNLWICEQ